MTTVGKNNTLSRVKRLKELFDSGAIKKTHLHEVHPDLPREDRINYVYYTLPVSINYQRSSPAMWRSALETYHDPETQYLFYPERTARTPLEKVRTDLGKHRLGLQINRHTNIWMALSQTFASDYDADPRRFLEECRYDVEYIIHTLRTTKKKKFPYLSGPKMANYWLYILHLYTDIPLIHLDQISIIPDTHVQQASRFLGITTEKAPPDQTAEAWSVLLEGSGIRPIDMHPVLWNWSREGFMPKV